MDLNSILVSEFAKITNDNKETVNEGTTVYGTYRVDSDGAYVQIDGSDTRTPVATTSEARNGDRVTVLIKNHRAIITGNLTDPSTTVKSVEERIETGIGNVQETIDTLKTKLDNQEITLDEYREAIAEAKRYATDYIDFSAGTGLVIGSSSISSNVRIYSGGIDIRDGNSILASYTDDAISLGANSSNSVIDMCGGKGSISYGKSDVFETDSFCMTSDIDIGIASEGGGVRIIGQYGRMLIGSQGLRIAFSKGGSTAGLYMSEGSVSVIGNLSGYAKSSHDHSGDSISPSSVYCSGNVRGNKITIMSPGSTSNTQAGLVYSSTYGGYVLVEYTGSSERYKHDIHSLNNDLKDKFRKLYDLEVKNWTYNDDYVTPEDELYKTETYGLIAEDVDKVLPEAVVHDQDGNIKNYRDRHILNAMLVLLQEQKKQLDSLESRIESLETKEVP